MGFRIDLPLGIQSPCQLMIGMYNHLQKTRYLASMKPFSVSVIGSLGYKQWYLFWLISAPKVDKPWVFSPKKKKPMEIPWRYCMEFDASFGQIRRFLNHLGMVLKNPINNRIFTNSMDPRIHGSAALNAHEGYQFGGFFVS